MVLSRSVNGPLWDTTEKSFNLFFYCTCTFFRKDCFKRKIPFELQLLSILFCTLYVELVREKKSSEVEFWSGFLLQVLEYFSCQRFCLSAIDHIRKFITPYANLHESDSSVRLKELLLNIISAFLFHIVVDGLILAVWSYSALAAVAFLSAAHLVNREECFVTLRCAHYAVQYINI